jgi:site-specific recombinase XerD
LIMTPEKQDPQTQLSRLISAWLIERRSRGLAPGTIIYYQDEIHRFERWIVGRAVFAVENITPNLIREYLLHLAETRNGGGVHASFRAVRGFLNWYEEEFEPDAWKNPILKVRPPKVNTQARPGIAPAELRAILSTCTGELAERDKTLLLFLFDTGLRAAELCALNVGDADLITGDVEVRHGKGDKHRTVHAGRKVLKLLRKYLKSREGLQVDDPLFATDADDRFSYGALKSRVYRLADQAKITRPGLHDFRRAFALECLRNGMDLMTLSKLLGHSNVSVTQRYLALNNTDLSRGHQVASPVDRM